jgi:hypothetical protein
MLEAVARHELGHARGFAHPNEADSLPIIAWLGALAAAALCGCASGPAVAPAGGAQRVSDAFVAFECGVSPEELGSDAELQARGAMLRLAQHVQSVTLRRVQVLEAGTGSALPYRVQALARIGEERPDGESQSICRDLFWSVELGALESLGLQGSARHTYFMVGTGNSFSALTTDDELRSLLGPVDTPAEAWFWLMRRTGIGLFSCGVLEDSAYRLGPSGIELRVRLGLNGCRPLTEALVTYRVARDGSVV